MKCRSCNTPIIQFFSLGNMPLVNALVSKNELKREARYPLTVGYCPHCHLVQLTKTINPAVLFRNYLYFSSTSNSFVKHCQETALYITRRFKLSTKDLVFEIASNDGEQLKAFQKMHIPVLGIDPAKNIARIANKKGIPTIAKFFNLQTANYLQKTKHVKANIIFGANVLAHVPKINDFLRAVKTILHPTGTAIFESPYIQGLFENKFDTIYHEHVFYYSATALDNLFTRNGLEVYDMDFTPMQGGSFRLFASHPGNFSKTQRFKKLLQTEKRLGYAKRSTYREINKNVTRLKEQLLQLLKKLKQSGNIIAAYGAPAKGVVLLNYFEINGNILDFLVDKAIQKQGLYVPGVHLKIESPIQIKKRKPDYILILCWNIAGEIMKQLETYHKKGGKFIIPIPKVKII